MQLLLLLGLSVALPAHKGENGHHKWSPSMGWVIDNDFIHALPENVDPNSVIKSMQPRVHVKNGAPAYAAVDTFGALNEGHSKLMAHHGAAPVGKRQMYSRTIRYDGLYAVMYAIFSPSQPAQHWWNLLYAPWTGWSNAILWYNEAEGKSLYATAERNGVYSAGRILNHSGHVCLTKDWQGFEFNCPVGTDDEFLPIVDWDQLDPKLQRRFDSIWLDDIPTAWVAPVYGVQVPFNSKHFATNIENSMKAIKKKLIT